MSRKKVASPCSLCDSPLRSAAASMRALGAGIDEIAASCGLTIGEVQRHFDSCFAPRATNDDTPALGGSDAELEALLRDSAESYHAATIAGNSAAAASSLNVRLRILTALGAREQLRAEQEANEAIFDPSKPETWSEQRANWVRKYLDAVLRNYDQQTTEKQKLTQ